MTPDLWALLLIAALAAVSLLSLPLVAGRCTEWPDEIDPRELSE